MLSELNQTATQRAYETLKSMIMDNALKPSASYLEKEIAEKLGTSRTPAREAMQQLEREGFVEMRPRHGMRVLPLSAKDMEEVYAILTELEPLAAELAAKRGLSQAEMAQMQEAVDQMDACLEEDNLNGWAEADDHFHSLLAKFSGNKRLEKVIGNFADQVHRARKTTLLMREKPVRSNAEHRAVLDKLTSQDGEGARKIHHEHRERSGRLIVALIEKHNLDNL